MGIKLRNAPKRWQFTAALLVVAVMAAACTATPNSTAPNSTVPTTAERALPDGLMLITDSTGRITLGIPDDWTWDPAPISELPSLGAGPPDAAADLVNRAVTAQIDPMPAGGDVEGQLRAIIDQLGLADQCDGPSEPVPLDTAEVSGYLIDWFPCGTNQLQTVAFAGTINAQPDELFSMVAITDLSFGGLNVLDKLRITARP